MASAVTVILGERKDNNDMKERREGVGREKGERCTYIISSSQYLVPEP